MTAFTIRPNGIYFNHGFTNGAGAGTIDARLGDNSDTTTAYFTQANFIRLQLGTFTIPAGHYVKRFRTNERVKVRTTSDGFTFRTIRLERPDFTGYNLGNIGNLDAFSLQTYTYGWWELATSTVPTTQADIDALILYYGTSNPGLASPSDYEGADVWVDFETNALPVPTVNNPTGTITTTTQPAISIDYDDADGDAMQKYQAKIFTSAVYGGGGFDPATSTAVWDSGITSLSVADGDTFAPTLNLNLANNTTYKVYVNVQQIPNDKWSGWTAGPAFTIQLDAPAIPTLTATADDANGRITLVAQARDNLIGKDGASFESGTGAWSAGASTSVAQDATQGLNGTHSLKITRNTSTGTAIATTLGGTGGKPVIPNAPYIGLASFKANSTGRSVSVDILWYKSDGSASTTPSTNGSTVSDTTGGWTQATVTATSPADAAFCALRANIASAVATEFHFMDQTSIAPGSSTTWTRGGFTDADQTIVIEVSRDGGTTYTPLRNGTLVDLPTSQQFTTYDYEATPNVAMKYRAYVSDLDTFVLASDYSSIQTVTSSPTTATGWTLKDLTNPALNMTPDIFGDTWDTSQKEEQAVYLPIGRSRPVVVRDVIRGIEGVLKMEYLTLADKQKFDAIRAVQRTLLLQRVYTTPGEQWYIALGADANVEESNHNPPVRRVTIQFVEVDIP